jgi:hypothetical protein
VLCSIAVLRDVGSKLSSAFVALVPPRESRRSVTLLPPERPAETDSFEAVFKRVFPRLSELYASFSTDGVLAVAVWDNRRITDYLHIRLDNEPEFAVIGRHDLCDLSLAHDPTVSLRHALVGARASGGEVRVRLLDLQSGSGFFTEDGRRCAALTADGALFARVGGYHLFLLPTGSLAPLPWGRTAEETWATIPERVYRDSRVPARPPALMREPLPVAVVGGRRPTIITQIVDPPGMLRPFRPAPGARGAAVARIELGSKAGFERFVVHEAELERGLLVGRYDRCQIGASDQALSRVHLLVIRDGDDCWTVDTASSNGTTWNGETVRRAPLRDGSVLVLARGLALRWRSVADAAE